MLDKWSEGTGEAYGCDMEKGDGDAVGVVDGRASRPSPDSSRFSPRERPRGEARTPRVPRAARRQLRRHAVLRHHLHRDSGESAGADQPQDLFPHVPRRHPHAVHLGVQLHLPLSVAQSQEGGQGWHVPPRCKRHRELDRADPHDVHPRGVLPHPHVRARATSTGRRRDRSSSTR